MTAHRQRFEQEALPHLDAAYNLARWLCRSPTDAEDIVQEALLLAFRGFASWRGGSAKAWLLAIVRNCHFSALRHSASRVRLTDAIDDGAASTPDALISTDTPEQTFMAADAARNVHALLLALSPEFREVVVLRELEELSYRDIAAITGVPIGTVMSRLARARAALKTQWLATNGRTNDDLP